MWIENEADRRFNERLCMYIEIRRVGQSEMSKALSESANLILNSLNLIGAFPVKRYPMPRQSYPSTTIFVIPIQAGIIKAQSATAARWAASRAESPRWRTRALVPSWGPRPGRRYWAHQDSAGRGPTSRAASSRYKPPCQRGCATDARRIEKPCGSGETRAASVEATGTAKRSRSRTRADYPIAAVHLRTLDRALLGSYLPELSIMRLLFFFERAA